MPGNATGLRARNDRYTVDLGGDGELSGRTVIIATGARYRRLDVPHLEDFDGAGVYYAATQAEALQCRHVPVAIVGGGNSAGQAAVFLARHATRVLLFVRGPELDGNMSRYLVDRIERRPEIEVFLHMEIRELHGHGLLEEVVAENNRTGEVRRFGVRALFVFIGADPCVAWLSGTVDLDHKGYVRTGGPQALPLETNLPGVLAAGDVRSGSIKRVASAVGEGRWPSVWRSSA